MLPYQTERTLKFDTYSFVWFQIHVFMYMYMYMFGPKYICVFMYMKSKVVPLTEWTLAGTYVTDWHPYTLAVCLFVQVYSCGRAVSMMEGLCSLCMP